MRVSFTFSYYIVKLLIHITITSTTHILAVQYKFHYYKGHMDKIKGEGGGGGGRGVQLAWGGGMGRKGTQL